MHPFYIVFFHQFLNLVFSSWPYNGTQELTTHTHKRKVKSGHQIKTSRASFFLFVWCVYDGESSFSKSLTFVHTYTSFPLSTFHHPLHSIIRYLSLSLSRRVLICKSSILNYCFLVTFLLYNKIFNCLDIQVLASKHTHMTNIIIMFFIHPFICVFECYNNDQI